MNRRQFLMLSAGLVLSSAGESRDSIPNYSARFLSAYDQGGRHYLGVLNEQLETLHSIELEWRGHGLTYERYSQQAILFARRPGNRAVVIHPDASQIIAEIETPSDRHFYGHGCFSQDGKYCFATENDYENAQGVISVWDTQNWQRLDEWSSGGTGPHDIHLMPDGRTLVVANGGIQTHPDYGRRKLNLDHMDSSLVYLNISSGVICEKQTMVYPYLSLRHLHVTRRGTVAIAMQSQQPDMRRRPEEPLLASHRQGEVIQPLFAPAAIQSNLQGYAADVVMSDNEDFVALTCPRANKIVTWNYASDETSITQHDLLGVSGVSMERSGGSILLSGDKGQLVKLYPKNDAFSSVSGTNVKWDNHLIAL